MSVSYYIIFHSILAKYPTRPPVYFLFPLIHSSARFLLCRLYIGIFRRKGVDGDWRDGLLFKLKTLLLSILYLKPASHCYFHVRERLEYSECFPVKPFGLKSYEQLSFFLLCFLSPPHIDLNVSIVKRAYVRLFGREAAAL